jgi:type IV pilus assembly protein PilB
VLKKRSQRSTGALSDLYVPDASEDASKDGVGARLLQEGVINEEQLADAQRVIKQSPGKTMAQILMDMGVHEEPVQRIVAEESRLPFERVQADNSESYDVKTMHRLTPKYCLANLVLPLRQEGERLVVGTASPDDVFVLDDVKRKLGIGSIKHVLLTSRDITAVLEQYTDATDSDYDVDEMLGDVDEHDVEVMDDKATDAELQDAESSPVVRFVNHIIQQALKQGASDIHIEPGEKTLKVRFRIDGVLFEAVNPPFKMHAAMVSRIKIMANLDIAERRLPQDGRIRANVLGRKLDLRVSTLPTPYGEKVVMRILDTRAINVKLEELGFADETLEIWNNQIAQPHGIILVTGPTGSGKTTTLYASLQKMDWRRLNISTVEDPVEYNLPNVTQTQVHHKIDMSFAAALRSLLRQDPDVIMVGEIRDLDTATVAVQASLTGHLVLSTLHTNDAPSSITRLLNIGIESFLVGAAVRAVLAQRLCRRICEHCKAPVEVKPELAAMLDAHSVTANQVMAGKGCERCRQTTYAGRIGLYELLVLDDHLRDAVAREPNVTEFRRVCAARGMVTLREDGFKKVANGATTVEEVLRVTESTI